MDDRDSGMEMMLSAIASPIDDDITWQFANQDDLSKEEVLDSAAQSPSSSLFDDFDDSSSSSLSSPSFQCGSGTNSLSSFDMMMNMFPDPTSTSLAGPKEMNTMMARKNVVVRRGARECSMVCWLFRTLLTSEYRALPLNAIYEIFEETLQTQSKGHGRHYRQSIGHCLMTSAVFVRVLTPNPRKDFLVMNEQGSWWTVHPDCELSCAEQVFRTGAAHRCPPTASIPAYFSRIRAEEAKAQNAMKSTPSSPRSECSSSACSSSSSSASNSPSGQPRRYDPIRRVTYGAQTMMRPAYRRFMSTPYNQPQKQQTTPPTVPNPPALVNPRSILLNDITVDHEEVV